MPTGLCVRLLRACEPSAHSAAYCCGVLEDLHRVGDKDRRPVHAHDIVDDARQQAAMPRDRERRRLRNSMQQFNSYNVTRGRTACNVTRGIQLPACNGCSDKWLAAVRRASGASPGADVAAMTQFWSRCGKPEQSLIGWPGGAMQQGASAKPNAENIRSAVQHAPSPMRPPAPEIRRTVGVASAALH